MIFAQLSHALSLNDICDCLHFRKGYLAQIRDCVPPSRNGLAHANATRDAGLAEELFWTVLADICTADQLSWMSEVFEQISAKLQSWEFIDALKRAADRFPEECERYNVRECISYAVGQLRDEVYRQRHPDFGK